MRIFIPKQLNICLTRRFFATKQYVVPKPRIFNAYEEDPILSDCMKRFLPTKVYETIEKDLVTFGKRVATDIWDLGLQCEQEKPKLEMFNCWGEQSNRLILSNAWKAMKSISAEEGLIAIPYERKYAEFSRLYHLAKLYLYMPSSGLFGCPLAMTDGAVHLLEGIGHSSEYPIIEESIRRMTSRDPNEFWTSGQWMTEIRGGSDVANATDTVAIPFQEGLYVLYGLKFYTSAADSDIAITLARVATNDKAEGIIPGNKGLALFLLKTHDEDGKLDRLRMLRLKDKLGTRQLPTAEMILDGCLSEKISEVGRGIAAVSDMLTITRFWTALSSTAAVRRMALLGRDFATRRQAFGKTLDNHSLHILAMSELEIEARAGLLLLIRMAQLLGLQENQKAVPRDLNLLRIIMPLAKGFVCKQAMPVLSEGLELFGAMGYMEDSGIPGLMRDAQVQPIWEGTTNMQALDLIRALSQTEGLAMKALLADIERLTFKSKAEVMEGIISISKMIMAPTDMKLLASSEDASRDFLMALGGLYSAALLYDHAEYTGNKTDYEIAERYFSKGRPVWLSVPDKLNNGYFASSNLESLKNAIFQNYGSK